MDQVLSSENTEERVRLPIVELLVLAGPTIAQWSSYTIMQFIDTWLLAHISDVAATAAGNSGMFAFSAISLGVGVLLLVNALVSQNFGHRNYAACGRYLWQGIWFSCVFSVLLQPVVPVVVWGFGQFGHPPDLLRQEAVYLQILVAACVVKFVGTAIGQFLLAVNRPGSVLLAAVAGVCVNSVAAYALILGKLGMPAMGVAGAAWAQNLGLTVEMLTLIYFATRRDVREKFNVLDWRPRLAELGQLLRVGIPSGAQIVAEVLAWSIFVASTVGAFGTVAMAANTYMFRFMSVSFMPAIGISTAVTALVGRYIGRGRNDLAVHRAHLGFRMTLVYMFSCGLLFFFGRHWLMGLFTRDPQVLAIGAVLLAFAGVYQIFDAMYIIYSGALRGAGDTLVPAAVTGILCWTVMVGGGYLVSQYVPALGVAGPWTAATAYGIVLGSFMLTRFSRGRWKSIHLAEQARSNSAADSATVSAPLLQRQLASDEQ